MSRLAVVVRVQEHPVAERQGAGAATTTPKSTVRLVLGSVSPSLFGSSPALERDQAALMTPPLPRVPVVAAVVVVVDVVVRVGRRSPVCW